LEQATGFAVGHHALLARQILKAAILMVYDIQLWLFIVATLDLPHPQTGQAWYLDGACCADAALMTGTVRSVRRTVRLAHDKKKTLAASPKRRNGAQAYSARTVHAVGGELVTASV